MENIQRQHVTDINDFALSQDSFFGKLASIFMGTELRERATKARLLFMFLQRDASPSEERGSCRASFIRHYV